MAKVVGLRRRGSAGRGPVKKPVKGKPPARSKAVVVRKQVAAQTAAVTLNVSSALSRAFTKRVDAIDKKMMLGSDLTRQPRMHTGLLTLDLILGPGYTPGMTVHFGAEASAKSTATWLGIGQSLKIAMPMRQVFDAEGATDLKYTSRVIGRDLAELFGKRSPQGGWEVDPMIRYRDTNITEHVFRGIHRAVSLLPDKRYSEERREWFLVFGRSKEETSLLKELGLQPDKRLFSETGQYWCSVGDDDTPLAMFAVDSLPALVPEAIDEEETSDKAMAINARMLGRVLPLVRGKLRAKACILLCVNQLRDKPGVTHGVPWYEPMGNVVKFSCMTGDARLLTSRGLLRADVYARDPSCSILGTDGLHVPRGFEYKGEKPIATVTLDSGHQLRASHDHAVSIFHPTRGEGFAKMHELYRGLYVKVLTGQDTWASDEVGIPSLTETNYQFSKTQDARIPATFGAQLALWTGMMVGDGSVSEQMLTYTGLGWECRLLQRLTKSLFDVDLNFIDKGEYWSATFYRWSVYNLCRWLGMDHRGQDKTVPEAVFRSPRPVVLAFIRGYLIADGHVRRSVEFTTCSEGIARGLQQLLDNLGCDSRLSKKRPSGRFHAGKAPDVWHYKVVLTRDASAYLKDLLDLRAKGPVNGHRVDRQVFGFPKVLGYDSVKETLRCKLEEVLDKTGGASVGPLLRNRNQLYRWAETLRTSHQRERTIRDLDRVYGMVDAYGRGYRWHRVTEVTLNGPSEPTFDGCMPTDSTIITNGIVSHNSDVRCMWTSRVPPPGWERAENKGLCVESSVEFPGRVDHYAFKAIGNQKNKYGTPFRKGMSRVWISDGRGDARGFDPVLDALEALGTLNLIDGPIHDSRRPFRLKIPKIEDYNFSYAAFKTLVLAESTRSRHLLNAAQELGAPQFKIRAHVQRMIAGNHTDLLIANAQGKRALPNGAVDIEAEESDE